MRCRAGITTDGTRDWGVQAYLGGAEAGEQVRGRVAQGFKAAVAIIPGTGLARLGQAVMAQRALPTCVLAAGLVRAGLARGEAAPVGDLALPAMVAWPLAVALSFALDGDTVRLENNKTRGFVHASEAPVVRTCR